jgi:hypothetical protein
MVREPPMLYERDELYRYESVCYRNKRRHQRVIIEWFFIKGGAELDEYGLSGKFVEDYAATRVTLAEEEDAGELTL